jgi:polysaccharide export outer membrane protein
MSQIEKSRARGWTAMLRMAAIAAIAALVGQAALAADQTQRTLQVTQLPPPDLAANASAEHGGYVIGPLDTLDVKVWPEADIGGEVQVDSNGFIDMPLAGQLVAAGKTSHQLADAIVAKLSDKYFQSPSVVVAVKQSVTNRFTVTGAVTRPGLFDISNGITLMQAIAVAGGVNEYANEHEVVIFRTIEQKRAAAVVNLTDVMKGRVNDPRVYPGDLIVVATSASKHVVHEIVQASPLLIFLHPLGF